MDGSSFAPPRLEPEFVRNAYDFARRVLPPSDGYHVRVAHMAPGMAPKLIVSTQESGCVNAASACIEAQHHAEPCFVGQFNEKPFYIRLAAPITATSWPLSGGQWAIVDADVLPQPPRTLTASDWVALQDAAKARGSIDGTGTAHADDDSAARAHARAEEDGT
jgi:hypothetical protein